MFYPDGTTIGVAAGVSAVLLVGVVVIVIFFVCKSKLNYISFIYFFQNIPKYLAML